MQIKKGLCKIRKLYYTRLCECMGIYRHVVVNLVLFFATCMYTVVNIVLFFATCMYTVVNIVLFFATCMYTVVWGYDVQCMQAQRTIQWTQNLHTKDQSYGPMVTQCMYKRTIL